MIHTHDKTLTTNISMIIISYSSKKKKRKKKEKSKDKYQTKQQKSWYKYILTLYTLTLAKSTKTIYTKQPTREWDPYLTWGCAMWVLGCMRVRGGVREGKTTMSVGIVWERRSERGEDKTIECVTRETQTKKKPDL